MYKTFKNITLLTLSLILMGSCDDYLSLEPESEVIRQDFWKTKEHVHSAIIGCYASLLEDDLTKRLFTWGELRGDMVAANVRCSYNYRQILEEANINAFNDIALWSAFYKTINLCNTVLDFGHLAWENDKSFSKEQLKAYEAEALTIRSLMYFYLVRSFGDVPLTLKSYSSDEQKMFIAKTPAANIIKQILSDLEIAEASAVSSHGDLTTDRGRITKYTINALQADIYLWNEENEKCVEACNKIINSGQYGLVTGANWFADIFVRGNSNESILELQFNSTKKNPYYGFFHKTDGQQFKTTELSPNLYETADVRGDSATYLKTDDINEIFKYIGLGFSDEGPLKRTSSSSTAHWIVYRYADILLLKAEALNQLKKGTESIEILHRIQSRAGATLSFADIDDYDEIGYLILVERQKELAYEGKRWFDILRNSKRNNYEKKSLLFEIIETYAPADQAKLIKNKYSDPQSHYLPIYYLELDANIELIQNPYYE